MKAGTLPVIGMVLHFRTPETTLACLRSLLSSGIGRVVVMDNSEDNGASVESMMGDIDVLQESGLAVELISAGRNLGFAGGVSYAIEHMGRRGDEYVLLINSDATLDSGALDNMLDAAESADVVVPRIAPSGGESTSPMSCYDRLLSTITRNPVLLPVRYPSGCCLLLKGSLVRPDLLDQDFFFYGEDVMFGFEAVRRGLTIVECKEAVVRHSGALSAANGSLFYEYHMNRAHWLLASKLASNGFESTVCVLARCFMLPLRALVRSIRLRSVRPWKGLAEAFVDVLRGTRRSFTPPAKP